MQFVRTLAGVAMPPLIYGTAWKKDKTADLVVQAVRSGFRGVDTACQPKHYNETGVGEALQRLAREGIPRQNLYIQTKFTPLNGQDPLRIPYDAKAPLLEQVAQSFEASKVNLGVSSVDCFILHSPLETLERTMVAWEAMEQIYEQKGTRQLGLSNCYDLEFLKRLFQAATIKPAVLQNRFYQETGYDAEIRQWCHARKIVYQSFWTLTANPHILSHEIIQKAALKYQKTPAQIFFRVLIEEGIVPLTGTCSHQHMLEDLAVFEFSLPSEQIKAVSALLKV